MTNVRERTLKTFFYILILSFPFAFFQNCGFAQMDFSGGIHKPGGEGDSNLFKSPEPSNPAMDDDTGDIGSDDDLGQDLASEDPSDMGPPDGVPPLPLINVSTGNSDHSNPSTGNNDPSNSGNEHANANHDQSNGNPADNDSKDMDLLKVRCRSLNADRPVQLRIKEHRVKHTWKAILHYRKGKAPNYSVGHFMSVVDPVQIHDDIVFESIFFKLVVDGKHKLQETNLTLKLEGGGLIDIPVRCRIR